jgi:Calcineurin-like phosphoesterase
VFPKKTSTHRQNMPTSRFRIPWIAGEHLPATKNNTYKFAPTPDDGVMTLADIVGAKAAAEIEKTGQLQFHTVGDTGRGPHTAQQDVAEAMTRDINPNKHRNSPAFLFHLGDVIYGDGKEDLYDDEFYRPYADYPNKVVAIPGNHDGEEGVTMDKESLKAFRENFCAPAGTEPPFAKTFNCEMVKQPGVYWMLETKLLDLIGLYSNAAETVGTLGDANVGMHQLDWLTKTLKTVAQEPAI